MRIDGTQDPHRLAVVEEARAWLATPYRHQAAVKHAGCDCGGLVRGVGEAAGVLHMDPMLWRRFANYGRLPNPRQMKRILSTFLDPVWERDDGELSSLHVADILWLEWRLDLPMHLGIVAADGPRPTLIHALADFGQVVEHGITAEWRVRISSVWRFPGLAGR